VKTENVYTNQLILIIRNTIIGFGSHVIFYRISLIVMESILDITVTNESKFSSIYMSLFIYNSIYM